MTDRQEDRAALRDKTSREDRAKRRLENLRCACCPPHAGENLKRRPNYGSRKPRSKNKRT